MCADMGVKYAIIGHSERKISGLDDSKSISAKISNCLLSSITPIICVGETKEERHSVKYLDVIKAQIVSLNIPSDKEIIVAYEPIWSVGTGVLPSSKEIEAIMNLIRSTLNIASKLILVYGGSVNAENARDIVHITGVDGLLIGKASTDSEHFRSIIDIIR
jgi:triosephosphate isomerase